MYPPQIHENNGATKTMLPQEAKLRNFTYASAMTIDINIKYIIRNNENMENEKVIEKKIPKNKYRKDAYYVEIVDLYSYTKPPH